MKSQYRNDSIKFKKLHADAIIPTRGTENAVGFDLYALHDVLVVGGEGSVIIPTGIAVQLLPGTYGRIAARSGLAVKEHIAVNGGVIDIDFTGSVGIIAYCTKNEHSYLVKQGERIAQLVPEVACYAMGIEVDNFETKYPQHDGWGSTGRI